MHLFIYNRRGIVEREKKKASLTNVTASTNFDSLPARDNNEQRAAPKFLHAGKATLIQSPTQSPPNGHI